MPSPDTIGRKGAFHEGFSEASPWHHRDGAHLGSRFRGLLRVDGLLLDLRAKGLTGKDAEKVLESVGILTNKNVIPYDPENPLVGSGLRLGTSAISSRGMGRTEVVKIAGLINDALLNRDKRGVLERVAEEVAHLCKKFPVY